jgi:hypothetical protein
MSLQCIFLQKHGSPAESVADEDNVPAHGALPA